MADAWTFRTRTWGRPGYTALSALERLLRAAPAGASRSAGESRR